MITVKAIKCPNCKCTIFSRARHDLRSCSCELISIDGGFNYIRMMYPLDMKNPPKAFDLEIEQTREELFKDWTYSKDKYGIIQEEDEV